MAPRSAKTSPHNLTRPEGQPLTMVDLPPHEEAEELSRVPQEDEMGGPHGGTSERTCGHSSHTAARPHEFTFTGALPHLEGAQGILCVTSGSGCTGVLVLTTGPGP